MRSSGWKSPSAAIITESQDRRPFVPPHGREGEARLADEFHFACLGSTLTAFSVTGSKRPHRLDGHLGPNAVVAVGFARPSYGPEPSLRTSSFPSGLCGCVVAPAYRTIKNKPFSYSPLLSHILIDSPATQEGKPMPTALRLCRIHSRARVATNAPGGRRIGRHFLAPGKLDFMTLLSFRTVPPGFGNGPVRG